jgi:hypothetical protein
MNRLLMSATLALAALAAVPASAQSAPQADGIIAPTVRCETAIPPRPNLPDGANTSVRLRDMQAGDAAFQAYQAQVNAAISCQRMAVQTENEALNAELDAFNARTQAFNAVGQRWRASVETFNARQQAGRPTPRN